MPEKAGVQEKEKDRRQNTKMQSLDVKAYPRSNIFLKFLRVIYKLIRLQHVSFFFYFTPFLMLFYQFYSFELNWLIKKEKVWNRYFRELRHGLTKEEKSDYLIVFELIH